MWRVSKVHLGWNCSTQCHCMLLYVPRSMGLFFSQWAFGCSSPFIIMTMSLWTFVYNFFFFGVCVVLIALDVYLGVGFTGSLAILYSTLRNCHAVLHSDLTVDIQTSGVRGFQFPHVPVSACSCLLNLERRRPGVKWSMFTSVIDLVSLGAPRFSLLGSVV